MIKTRKINRLSRELTEWLSNLKENSKIQVYYSDAKSGGGLSWLLEDIALKKDDDELIYIIDFQGLKKLIGYILQLIREWLTKERPDDFIEYEITDKEVRIKGFAWIDDWQWYFIDEYVIKVLD